MARRELVGVAEGDRARARQTEQEVREIRSGRRASEGEGAAGILLRHDVQPPDPRVAAGGNRVPSVAPDALAAEAVRPIAIRRVLRARQSGDAARERQRRRSPVDRILD